MSKESNMPIKAAHRVEFIITKLFFINNVFFNINNDPVKRISARGLLIPEILIMIKQIINALYQVSDLVYGNRVSCHILSMRLVYSSDPIKWKPVRISGSFCLFIL